MGFCIIQLMAVLLSCREISKSFGAQNLFEQLTLGIFDGDRIGLIGPNGAGKSTLLKIIAQEEVPEEGEVVVRSKARIAYVPQLEKFDPGKTIRDILFDTATEAKTPDLDAVVNRTLGLVGFDNPDADASSLSGGWQKRLTLARGMVKAPDLMLLDEPTNHLDIEGFHWLEQLLSNASYSWLLVSHDRYFLEKTTNKVMELNTKFPECVFVSEGGYHQFLRKKQEFLSSREKYKDSLASKVRRETEWLQRGPKARTTKSKARIDEAHRLIDELSDVRHSLTDKKAQIDFTSSSRKTKKLIEVKDVAKALGDKKIVNKLDLLLSPGTRLGILGGNGTGKTTILRLLSGDHSADKGSIRKAPDLKMVYFDQYREQLDPEWTLRRALSETGDTVFYRGRSQHVMGWAKRFRFREDQLPLPISRLSGGEQARLLISRLMLKEADVLLLDEPTNDLDIPTLEILEDSLSDYPGALVLVTHDRYMLSEVCNCFLGLDGKGGTQSFADVSQWEREFKAGPAKEKKQKEVKKVTARKKRLSYKDQLEYDAMEEKILEAETALEECQAAAEDPSIASNGTKLTEAYEALKKAQQHVEKLYERWSELEAMTE